MSVTQFGLAPQEFSQAFPFHLILNAALEVVQVGAVLHRLYPISKANFWGKFCHSPPIDWINV